MTHICVLRLDFIIFNVYFFILHNFLSAIPDFAVYTSEVYIKKGKLVNWSMQL